MIYHTVVVHVDDHTNNAVEDWSCTQATKEESLIKEMEPRRWVPESLHLYYICINVLAYCAFVWHCLTTIEHAFSVVNFMLCTKSSVWYFCSFGWCYLFVNSQCRYQFCLCGLVYCCCYMAIRRTWCAGRL